MNRMDTKIINRIDSAFILLELVLLLLHLHNLRKHHLLLKPSLPNFFFNSFSRSFPAIAVM